MNFKGVTAILLPQGKAIRATVGGALLWQGQKEPEWVVQSVEVTPNKRLSTSSGSVKENTGTFVTDFLPLGEKGDVLCTGGANFNTEKNGNTGVFIYQNNQTYWTFTYTKAADSPIVLSPFTVQVDEGGNLTITVTGDTPRYIRLCGVGTGEGLVVTRTKSKA